MTDEVLICPECRARVFPNWPVCKFCGKALRSTEIAATMHPDDLVGAGARGKPLPPPPDLAPAAGPDGRARPSPWDEPEPGGEGVGAPDDDTWALPAASAGAPGAVALGDSGSLVPVEGADPTWVPGPAPVVHADGGATGDDRTLGPGPSVDEGPSGLDPVSWYSEPGGPGGDASGPSGLDPVSWYPEPGGPGGDASGPSGLDPVSWYPEPGSSSPTDQTAPAGGFGPVSSGQADGGWDDPSADPDLDAARSASQSARESSSQSTRQGGSDDVGADDDGFAHFDPTELFREPEPAAQGGNAGFGTGFDTGFDGGVGSEIEPAAPAGEVAVNWKPATADAWNAPVEPVGKPKRQALLSRESGLLLVGIVLVLVVLAAGIGLKNRGESHPDQWAANVQEMADWVSKTRRLPFAHPIDVANLDGKAYDAAVAAAEKPDDDSIQQKLADQVAMWRALGGVQGDPAARLDVVAAQRPELGAFYDLKAKRLVLRAGTDTADLKLAMAGALSVALDDQRAKLSSLRSVTISEDPLFDVVLGTATLMRSDYRLAVGGDASKASDDPSDQESADDDRGVLGARPDLQVDTGTPFVQFVRAVKGLVAANGLATSPPVSSQQVMLPLNFLHGSGPLAVTDPEVPDGAEKLDSGSIGAQSWYLLLAAHVDDPAALDDAWSFADRWAGDSFVAYRKPDGQVCVSDVIRGGDQSDSAPLNAALTRWSETVPGGHVEVTQRATADGVDEIQVVGCDPRAKADGGVTANVRAAVTAAVTRSELATGYYLAGKKIPNGVNGPVFSPEGAWCMANGAVTLAQPDQWADLATRTGPVYRDLTLAAARTCNQTLADQLFVDRGD